MVSYARLKHRFKRFRYYNEARHPTLFRVLDFALFPSQVFVLIIAVWAMVSFYQKHYSHEAYIQQYANHSAANTAARRDHSSHLDQNNAKVTTASSDPALQYNNSGAPLEVAPVAPAQTTNVEALDLQAIDRSAAGNVAALPEDTFAAPARAAVVKTPEQATLRKPLMPEVTLHDSSWILNQPRNRFVIQLASSSDDVLLVQYARDTQIPTPAALYPFKRNLDQQLVYGLSTGSYASYDLASKAISSLDAELIKFGTWIRPVSTIQRQLSTLNSVSPPAQAANDK